METDEIEYNADMNKLFEYLDNENLIEPENLTPFWVALMLGLIHEQTRLNLMPQEMVIVWPTKEKCTSGENSPMIAIVETTEFIEWDLSAV